MESAVRTSTDSDNVLTIVLDIPGKPVNTCTPQLLAELGAVVDSLERAKPASRPAGLIIASAKARSFNAGADLFMIRDMDPGRLKSYLAEGQALFERIARLPVPSVAAINGDCLGGGMELALACTHRVAADDGSISLGLPEVKLGLIPAWGGATRLPRMIGLTKALPILLEGKTMPPRQALKSGLVDAAVDPETLLAAAKRLLVSYRRQRRGVRERLSGGLSPARNRVLETARRQTVERTFGNDQAPLRLLDVVRSGLEQGMGAGLAAEHEAILRLLRTDETRNVLRLFFLRQGAKRRVAARLNGKPTEVKGAGVIVGGKTGAGIVHALIVAGIPVRLAGMNPESAAAAIERIRQLLDQEVATGRLDEAAARVAFNRVSPTTEWTGLDQSDVVIEAVEETIDAKRDVFARLERVTRPETVLATNAHSLRVTEIAKSVNRPGRVIGLHFLDPVHKMALVEIVRAPESDDAALATGAALATRIGKTPLLVADAPGLLVNRLLVAHLEEALTLAREGASIPLLNDSMKRWGMSAGPFELLDRAGLGILEKGRIETATLPQLNEDVAPRIAPRTESPRDLPVPPSQEESQWRLVLPMVNEAARALSEGVIDSADDIDLATVLGLGFPPFRGGLATFVENAGVESIVFRLDEAAARHGPRFAPAELLRAMARDGSPFPRPKVAQRDKAP